MQDHRKATLVFLILSLLSAVFAMTTDNIAGGLTSIALALLSLNFRRDLSEEIDELRIMLDIRLDGILDAVERLDKDQES